MVPTWSAPVDVDAHRRSMPREAMIKGMYSGAVAAEAARLGSPLASARAAYIPFKGYPQHEHLELLVEGARAMFPKVPLREGLRRLGWPCIRVLEASMAGKVLLTLETDILGTLQTCCRAYALGSNMPKVEVVESGPGRAVVHLAGVHDFLDSHHVGVFEGMLRKVAGGGDVKVRLRSISEGDFLCLW